MSDVVIAWKKSIWGRNHIYPEIDSKVFLGLIRLFDTDKNEQVFVHREGEKIYYVYLWRLSKFDYLSLGLLTNKLCLDYYDLLRTFRAFVKDMAVNELCICNTKRGKIKMSSYNIQKQPRQRTLLDINIKNLKAQLDEKQKKWSNLPSQKLGVFKSDIVPCTLEIQGSSWIVTQVTSGYRNVCISIRDEIKPLNKDARSKDYKITSIVNFFQFLLKPLNNAKTAKALKSLNTTNGEKKKKDEKKHIDWDEVFATSVVGSVITSVLLCWIAPWFISSMQMWLKITSVVVSCFGVFLVICVSDDNYKGKFTSFLGWSGAMAILLPTVLTIYGLCGGFSTDTIHKVQLVSESKTGSESEQGNNHEYEKKNERLDLSMRDRSNDSSDVVLMTDKAEKERIDGNASTDSISIDQKDSAQSVSPIENSNSTVPFTPKIPKDFVLVPSGILKNEREWNDDGEVVYNVSIDSFYICRYELTQIEYKRVVGKLLPENYTWNIQIDNKDAKVVQQGDSIPLVATYQEFAEYCNKRSRMEGYDGFYEINGSRVKIKHDGNGYRLLNHFEWTYAARGGNANERYSYVGSNKIGEVAWYGGNSKYRPHEVGKKKANSLGIYDMSGNVSEMLLDDPKSPYRLIGGEGFEYWAYLGPNDILGMDNKNMRNGTRIALIPKKMTNNNTKLTWKYKW